MGRSSQIAWVYRDEVARDNERGLLEIVMQQGKNLRSPSTLEEIRQRVAASVASLPPNLRQISHPDSFSVNISPALESLRQSVTKTPVTTN